MNIDRERLIQFIIIGFAAAIALIPAIIHSDPTVYGESPYQVETVKISAIYDDPSSYVGKTVKVEGLTGTVIE